MPDKILTLTVEDKQAVCNFGINYFYKHYHEQTGTDLLVSGFEEIKSSKIFETLPALFYSGYLAQCSKSRKDPELSKEDFNHYVYCLDEAGAGKMFTDYVEILTKGVKIPEGEPEGQMEKV